MSLFEPQDLFLFNEGTHARLWDKLGCHPAGEAGRNGAWFSVWAPNAERVDVVGDFNGWAEGQDPLQPLGESGIWEGFVASAHPGNQYKYRIASRHGGVFDKADPLAVRSEIPPRTASVVHQPSYEWQDGQWMEARQAANALDAPISIYEVHIGSWARVPEDGYRSLSYRELAPRLADHVEAAGFTHVEFLPVMEHPFFGSWGYQVTGYFAPSARYGTPEDLKYLIDYLHRRNIGVILDWVPSHFPEDAHGLGFFDGTHLFEHADPRAGFHPDWSSLIFNYGRKEVRSFLISNALYWLGEFHADGLRVDAVASMLYLDYSRAEGEWIPNVHGGRENLEAIDFLKSLNAAAYRDYPDIQMIAEESTSWPGVTAPVDADGLGFGLKWDMGWMHDILVYMSRDPVHRRWHHSDLTFRQLYAFTENFVLPFSHDEVVHGKGSLLGKMAGDDWQKRANLRLLYGCMFAQPGKKLLFMGDEFGQPSEWNHDGSLDWETAADPAHEGIRRWVRDLNALYRTEPSLHELDCDAAGFEWIAPDDHEQNVISFLRHSRNGGEIHLVVCNFAPVPRTAYRVGVPLGGSWVETLNSDAADYGGSGVGNLGRVQASSEPFHGRSSSLEMTVPPLAAVFLKHDAGA